MKWKCLIFMFLLMPVSFEISVAAEDTPPKTADAPVNAADAPPKKADSTAIDNTPLAKGDGFVVTQNDVNEFRAFIEKGSQRTTEEEYKRFTIMLRLFAEEAKALGLDKDKPADINTFSGRGRLSEMYMGKLSDSYLVKDDVIESYYLAHPDMYKTDKGEIKPIDAEIKKQIREKVIVVKKSSIQKAELERLKQKYHLCEGECK